VANTVIKREAISKSVRFEVFKRDCFKCQYCGAVAPEVVLVIDHILAVANGGDNHLTNLITSCVPCNAGKRDVSLDERAAVAKARRQMEELQERREQLEMMMMWRQGLRALDDETVNKICAYWNELTPGWTVSDHGKLQVKKWLRAFSIEELTKSMETSAVQYLKRNKAGKCTRESWDLAFNRIPGICQIDRLSKENPELKQLYYIRGIVRNRMPYYYDNAKALQLLRAGASAGIPLPVLREIAQTASNWDDFEDSICAAINEIDSRY
jgi:hypothetical protein